MDEAAIQEGFNVWANANENRLGWVKLFERTDGVELDAPSINVILSPDQARRLAARLYRLARRVDARKAAA